jgi:hypothetical protein
MSELFDDKSPEEHEDIEQAIHVLDPSGHINRGFNYFLRRLDEVRSMDDDDIPDDISDAWAFRDARYVAAVREYHDKFYEAVEAYAGVIASERAVDAIREVIRREISPMLIARNKIAAAPEITAADFTRPLDTTPTSE